jgi:hypothetical protein
MLEAAVEWKRLAATPCRIRLVKVHVTADAPADAIRALDARVRGGGVEAQAGAAE